MSASDKDSTDNKIRIMLVEDHQITRIGLRCSLEVIEDFKIIAEAEDGKTAVAKAQELNPDVILMDIGLPGLSGIEAVKAIKILMLTSHERSEDVYAALSVDCDGYCLKDIDTVQLTAAIRAVHNGGVWLDPGIAKHVVKGHLKVGPAKESNNDAGLSERELEVLTLVVEGLSNQEIADRLFVSAETVKTHMRHLMEKLAVSDRTQAAVKALREGLV